jgi:hypothetical protein
VDELARQLYGLLQASTREIACVPYDHPLRQWHNRGVDLGGAGINSQNFDVEAQDLLQRLYLAGLSAEGRKLVPRQQFLRWTGLRMLRVLMAGSPQQPPYQIVFSGPHLNLRIGGKSREGVAFGGPQVYGDQRGNGQQGLPGNLYRFQLVQGHALFSSLTAHQKREALVDRAPIQTQIELQGDAGNFAGVAVGDLSTSSQAQVRELIRGILRAYPENDVAYAWDCLEANGGVQGLHLSYYQEGNVDHSGQYQIFRLEGPAAVFYYRGYPHLHAFFNVAMDGNRPLSVGEQLGYNPEVLEGESLCRLFERVMQSATGADRAFYDPEAAVGKLRTGIIRSGDIYNLESWNHRISVVTLRGSQLTGTAAEQVRGSGPWRDNQSYKIATTDYLAGGNPQEYLGEGEVEHVGLSLRDATIEYLRNHGFSRSI